MPLEKVFSTLFGPDSGDDLWMQHFQGLGYSGVNVGAWEGRAGEEGAPVSRQLRYTVPVKGLAVKQADTESRHVRSVVGTAGCVVDAVSVTPKVPYGNSFRTLVRYRLLPGEGAEGDGASVVEVSAEVQFVKEIMRVIRNKIKVAGYGQMKEAGKALLKDLKRKWGGGGGEEGDAKGGEASARMETWLLKQSNKIRSWNPRWCLVSFETGVFEWRKNPKDYTPNGFLHLRKGGVRVTVQNIRGDPKYEGRCFTVTDAKRSMYFTAETPALCLQWVQALRRVTGEEDPESERNGLLAPSSNGEAIASRREGSPASVVRLMVGQSKNIVSADSTKLGVRRLRFTVQFGDVSRTTRMERCGQDAVWDETFSFSTKGISSRQIQIIAEETIPSGGAMHSLGSLYVDLDQFAFDEPTSFWSILRTNPDAGVKSAIAGKLKLTLQIISMEGDESESGGSRPAGSEKPAGGGLPALLSCCLGARPYAEL